MRKLMDLTMELYQIAESYKLDNFFIFGRSIDRTSAGLREGVTKFIHIHENIQISFCGNLQNSRISFQLNSPNAKTFRSLLEKQLLESENIDEIRPSESELEEKIYTDHFDASIEQITLEQLLNWLYRLSEYTKGVQFDFSQMLIEKQVETRTFIHSKDSILNTEKKNMIFFLLNLHVRVQNEVLHVPIFEIVNMYNDFETKLQTLIRRINSYNFLINNEYPDSLPTEINVIFQGQLVSKIIKKAYPALVKKIIKEDIKISSSLDIINNPHLNYGNTGRYFTDDGEVTKVFPVIIKGVVSNEARVSCMNELQNVEIIPNNNSESFDDDNSLILLDQAAVLKITKSFDFFIVCHGLLKSNGRYVQVYPSLRIEGNIVSLLQHIDKVGDEIFYSFPDQFTVGSPCLKIKKDFFTLTERGVRIL
ncbi:hypothetical protein [Sporosarcina sp. Marseille-Q4943]|uniref:hypothetical protein n=1 Tax=Sporosarcina sp. Marseille-Q4943 TaxID=2942204 RepID=UPI00208DC448|nr:hypothetical protein [Sporosarcina sp. Marseille-Q4943]